MAEAPKTKKGTRFQIYGVIGDPAFDQTLQVLHALKKYEFPVPRKFDIDENGSTAEDFADWLTTTVDMREKMGPKAAAHTKSPLLICNGSYLGGLSNLKKFIKKKFHMSAEELLARVGAVDGGHNEEELKAAHNQRKPGIPKPGLPEKKKKASSPSKKASSPSNKKKSLVPVPLDVGAGGANDAVCETKTKHTGRTTGRGEQKEATEDESKEIARLRARIKAARTATRQAQEHAERHTVNDVDEERKLDLMAENKRVREELREANARLSAMLHQKDKGAKKPSPLFLIKAGQTLRGGEGEEMGGGGDTGGMSAKQREDRARYTELEKKTEELEAERRRVLRRLDRGGQLQIIELTNVLIDKDRRIVQILDEIKTLDIENELQKGEEVTSLRKSLRGLRAQQESYAKAQNMAQTIIRAYQAKAQRNNMRNRQGGASEGNF